MAPALVHFLVGASVLLAIATPFARYSERVPQAGLWLVVAGGVWGLVPDLHNVTPAYGSELYALHESPWMNLFAFHYSLDRPVVRALYHESIVVAIATFLLAVTVFTIAGQLDPNRSRGAQLVVSMVQIAVTTLLAAVVFGGMVYRTGRVDAVAALVGGDGTRVGMALIFAVSAVGSLAFTAILAVAPDRYARDPLASSLLGIQLGLVAWMLGIAVALPVWIRLVLETGQPLPFVDWPSLLALVLAGCLGGIYRPIVRRLASPPRPNR